MKAYYRVRTEYDESGFASCKIDGIRWSFVDPDTEIRQHRSVLIVRRYFENDADAEKYVKGRMGGYASRKDVICSN